VRLLSIMPTYQCTAACDHCGTLSSPKDKTWLTREHFLSAIRQAHQGDYAGVVFTGGEATLAGAMLLEGIRLASGLGMSTRVVTNAWWARKESKAAARVRDMRDAGLNELNLSTGDQHARFVPIENIITAATVSLRAGIPVSIMIESTDKRVITRHVLESHVEWRRMLRELPAAKPMVLESPWMPLEVDQVSAYDGGLAINSGNIAGRTGCDSVLSNTTVHADGSVTACCGIASRIIPEMRIGRVTDRGGLAEADRVADRDFVKHWLRAEGPERILAWAASIDPSIEWEDMYAHRCHACVRMYSDSRVRQVISEHFREKIQDVAFAEWLLYDFEAEAPEASRCVEPG